MPEGVCWAAKLGAGAVAKRISMLHGATVAPARRWETQLTDANITARTGWGARSRASQEAVTHMIRVHVEPRNHTRRVDARGVSVKGARDIEGGDDAVGRPQETVHYETCVHVESRDLTRRVDTNGVGMNSARCGGECGYGAVAGPQKAVKQITRRNPPAGPVRRA